MTQSAARNKIIEASDAGESISLCQELIKIPSHEQYEAREGRVAEFIYNYLKSQDIEVIKREVVDGRPNVIAILRGTGGGNSLMLNGHIDTVPPFEMDIEPFNPVILEDRIYGRGAADMKGAIAAMMEALLTLHRANIRLSGDLVFTAVIDEERRSEGTEDIIRTGSRTDMAIVGEPTELQVAIAHKGLEWMEIVVKGKTAHSGAADKGINAISKAAKLITVIEGELVPELNRRTNALLGPSTLNFGKIEGGDQPSTVAGECRIQIDRRWIPEETLDMILGDFQRVIHKLTQEDPQFQAEIRRLSSNMATMEHMPMQIDANHPLVNAVSQATSFVTKTKPDLVAFPAWTDASLLSNFGKIDCLIFGPGSIKQAHAKVEYVSATEVAQAAKVYALAALEICGIM